MAVDIPTYAYAVCVAVGGVVGYVKAGSMISLAMGLTSGALLGLGAYQTSQDPSNFYLPLGVSSTLLGVMGYRFYESGKFMPAGMVATMSLLFVVRFGMRMLGN